jgi:hypothetical protein
MSGKKLVRRLQEHENMLKQQELVQHIPVDDLASMIINMALPNAKPINNNGLDERAFINKVVKGLDSWNSIKSWYVDSGDIDIRQVRDDICLLISFDYEDVRLCDICDGYSYNYSTDSDSESECSCYDKCSIVNDLLFYLPYEFKINKHFKPLTEDDMKIITRYIEKHRYNCANCNSITDGYVYGFNWKIVPNDPLQKVCFND